jgi:hypothetical protein
VSPLNHSFVSPKSQGSDTTRPSANEWNGPHVVSGVVDFTAASRFLMPDTLFGAGRPWIDVMAKGAVGDGVTDDTTAIQNAINAAKTTKVSGIVYFPNGNYVVSQVTVPIGLRLMGSGCASPAGNAAGGSQLLQKPGTDLDLIVFSSVDAFCSNVEIDHLRLIGASGTTLSSGINFSVTSPNYGTTLHNLIVGGFAKDGIKLSSNADAVRIYDCQLSGNGIGAGSGYGLELNGGGGFGTSSTFIAENIYGDGNKSGLILLKTASGIGTGAVSFILIGIKGEKSGAGVMNDLIVLDGMNGSPVTVIGASTLNTSGEEQDAIIKIVGASADLTWFGLNAYTDASHGAGNGVAYFVNDAFQGVTFPATADGTSGTNRKFGSFSFTNLAATLLSISGSITLAHLLASGTAPTISSGFGTSPSISGSNGTACFRVTVGTGGVASSGVISLPAASQGWMCIVNNINAASGNRADNTRQTANTSTSVTLQNQTTSTGAATPWVAGDTLFVICFAY